MKKDYEKLRDNLSVIVDDLAVAMSRAIGNLETRFDNLENEHKILLNQCLNLSNRLNYIEKKILK